MIYPATKEIANLDSRCFGVGYLGTLTTIEHYLNWVTPTLRKVSRVEEILSDVL